MGKQNNSNNTMEKIITNLVKQVNTMEKINCLLEQFIKDSLNNKEIVYERTKIQNM